MPAVKSLESFDFDAIPGLNKRLVLDLARCEFVARRENVIMLEACLQHDALGPSGTGKTHIACGIGLAACQRGVKTRFATAAAIVHEMIEAQDEKRLMRGNDEAPGMPGASSLMSAVAGSFGAPVADFLGAVDTSSRSPRSASGSGASSTRPGNPR